MLQTISYLAERVVGTGSFGVVFQVIDKWMDSYMSLGFFKSLSGYWITLFFFQAKCLESGEQVAIKKVLQDKRYKNRELQIMRLLENPNVVQLKHCFFSKTEKDEVYLNLVLEYVPETIYRVLKNYSRINQHMPIIYVQLYTYQVRLCT